MIYKYLSGLLMFLLVACASGEPEAPFEHCKYDRPEAIFYEGLPGLRTHNFQLDQHTGEETLQFSDGLVLKIIQSGCNTIRQEFHFRLPDKFGEEPESFWVSYTVELLERLGSLGPDYLAFSSWAKAIDRKEESIRLGRSLALQEGFYARIDRLQNDDYTILLLTLSEEP